MAGVADPRPRRRVVDRDAGTTKLRREGRCRACHSRGHLSRAHLVPKGQGGDDVDDNIVPLCGGGTDGCHGALTDHHVATWPSMLKGEPWTTVAWCLRMNLLPEETHYMVDKKGDDWIERVYPT